MSTFAATTTRLARLHRPSVDLRHMRRPLAASAAHVRAAMDAAVRLARVAAFLLGDLVGQSELALESAGEVAAHQRGVRHPSEARLDDEPIDDHLGMRADRRLPDVERVQREYADAA